MSKTELALLPLTAVALWPLPSIAKVTPGVVLSMAVGVPTVKVAMEGLKTMVSASAPEVVSSSKAMMASSMPQSVLIDTVQSVAPVSVAEFT